MSEGPFENTDIILWEKVPGDYYSPKISATKSFGGAIAINVGGTVYVKPVEAWHKLPADLEKRDALIAELVGALERIYEEDDTGPDVYAKDGDGRHYHSHKVARQNLHWRCVGIYQT